ncbi:hypothetical protein D6C89_08162 [Aureobasidium pullulans]|nr:hypothetical protein D6C89_08162 [Aureobasidium pullulans]
MKKSFASRRVPRKIGQDDQDALSDVSSNNDSSAPTFVKRPGPKSRKSSALRPAFASTDDDNDDSSTLLTPKRSNISRLAIQRNAENHSDISFRPRLESTSNRPSYSRDYLDELKQSTPATPKDVASVSTTDTENAASVRNNPVDVKSKFGSDLSRYQPPTAIPTAAEIQEKKTRRARLAKENDFISLEDDGDDEDDDDAVTRDEQGRLILKPKEKYPETRLVHDDEDMLEGFDDFTTEGKMTFGRKAQKEEDRKRRAEMASMIADAEGQSVDEDEEDESEAERNAAFEVAQTRHGTYAAREQEPDSTRPQTPPRVVPLPTMDSVIERLRKRLEEMEMVRANKANEMQSLVEEKSRIGEEEIRVQAALKETGEKYQKLRQDMGLRVENDDKQVAMADDEVREPVNDLPEDSEASDEGDEDDNEGRPGLGTSGLGSGMRRDMSDWEEAARMAFFERIHDLLAVWYLSEGPKLKGALQRQISSRATLACLGFPERRSNNQLPLLCFDQRQVLKAYICQMSQQVSAKKQQELQAQYSGYKETLQAIAQKIGDVETEAEEHKLVLETLEPLPGDRKCFRMINGVLVERTVQDVLPQLKTNADGLKKVLEDLLKQYTTKQEELEKWKRQNKIQVVTQ